MTSRLRMMAKAIMMKMVMMMMMPVILIEMGMLLVAMMILIMLILRLSAVMMILKMKVVVMSKSLVTMMCTWVWPRVFASQSAGLGSRTLSIQLNLYLDDNSDTGDKQTLVRFRLSKIALPTSHRIILQLQSFKKRLRLNFILSTSIHDSVL